MKRIQTTILGISLLSFSAAFGQTPSRVLNQANMRQGETVEYCHQQKKLNEMLADPAFAAQYAIDQATLAQREVEMLSETPKRLIYKIPVVFHVLHNNGNENISREQILDAVAIMNRDYRLQNADAATVHYDFNASNPSPVCQPADVEIEFVLATKDPAGNCFSGITRTVSDLTFNGDDGGAQVDAIVAGNDVYNGQWPGNKYLNIFVADDIGGAAGYTTNPGFAGMQNGIWVLHNYTGSIGTSSVNTSRTLTHEAGHWLNLSHTWGGTNNPGVACGSDNVSDTPQTRGVTECNLNENFCGVRANVENYMDYSYCSKMFTQGQVTRMRASLTSNVGGRNNIWTASNLAATGTNVAPALCAAQFSTPKREICLGEQIQFTDQSYNTVTGWSWSFPGGTPSSSTAQNPLVTYNTPGTYQVTLTATDGSSSDGETKLSYVTVLPASSGLPFYEGFEGISSLTGTSWKITNPENNNTWEVTNTAGHSGTQSAKLTNFGQPAGGSDELISSAYNLSTITSAAGGVTLSFRYAYRKRAAANDDYLKVFVSNDCGGAWAQRKTMHGTSLSNEVATSSWTPAAADWGTVHMTNITNSYWVSNFRFKFRFEGDNGNNVFLDDINLYAGPQSDAVVLGVSEESFQNAVVYPNPADEEINVSFTSPNGQKVTIAVTDLMGHVIGSYVINANEGENLVNISTEAFAAGMYLIRLNDGNKAMQFVVK